jgi:alpha/beta superfamily hydrolase
VLEGVSHRGTLRPGLLVVPPPPAEGGGMDHVVGAELAYALSHAGFPTLRFNYRGVGASQGKKAKTPSELLVDARAAVELARDNADGAWPAVVSIGASDAVALKLAEELPLPALGLVNPTLVKPADLAALRSDLFVTVIAGAQDDSIDREGFGLELERFDGALELVPGASKTYQRNLPMVGKAIVALLTRCAAKRRD